ncbi:aminopeptidase N [Legionella sp. D16C41]|uniref:aminopeptidase N n=1 Tax=Legionella sp. D16C41 TaxID=3402688 RepID=UPI003AF788F3
MPTVKLADYKPSDYQINHTKLKIELDEEKTIVTATLKIKKENQDSAEPLILNGGDFDLVSIYLDGKPLNQTDYSIENNNLKLKNTPQGNFEVRIVTALNPSKNTKLEGLYKAGDILTTQCEAEGFRNITYYLDRPDVLAPFTTEIHADKRKFPILLSNGNLVNKGTDENNPNKHFFIYDDPIPKPSYLFAMVAGDLALREDKFITRSGKNIQLKIFVPEQDLNKTEHAMDALKAAMRFDEEHYDREYDLSIYNIVGVPQFNAGAMENKGLNIFNNSSLLAHPSVSIDTDFEWVYGTIGHEYFHNWRGNRVTVKNWFQLSLKEGFASITEQEFSQTLFNSMTSRIDDIIALQNRQFKEDAGPLAHPVLPTEYETPDNIYSMTIYLKGAELLNMLKSLLGNTTFKHGCSIYFAEHDGKAANIEDFIAAMEKASNKDLSQFLLWYHQAGTPQLEIEDTYDEKNKIYHLNIKQSYPPTTQDQPAKKPLLIPIAAALLDKSGQEIPLQLQTDAKEEKSTTRILELTQPEQQFSFIGVTEKPTPSLLRNFSAPVKIIKSPITLADYKFLLKYDQDPINRWFAAQNLARSAIQANIVNLKNGHSLSVDPELISALRAVLVDKSIEPRLKGQLLSFPATETLFELMQPAKPDFIYRAHQFLVETFIEACYPELKSLYQETTKMLSNSNYDPQAAGLRMLKNTCLDYLVQSNRKEAVELCINQLRLAKNMTERLGALSPLAIYHHPSRESVSQAEMKNFIQQWQNEPLVVEHILNLYALSDAENALDQIKEVMQSPLFKKDNPSHARELIRSFYLYNPLRFHDSSGKGYQFLADCIIEIDAINPSTAAILAPAFSNWKMLDSPYQTKMLEQLFRLYKITTLSDNVKEIINKSIQDALEMKKFNAQKPLSFFSQSPTPVTRSTVEENSIVCTSPM